MAGSAIVLIAAAAFGVWWLRIRPGRLDLVVCGERVFDGERWLSRGTCVGVRDGKVKLTGYLQYASAKIRIPADGLVVAPGFIDLHTHVEKNVSHNRAFRAPNFVQMGVTTLVTGNCGTSAPNIAAFLDGLELHGSQVNVATLVGHNTVRESVMGTARREASATEVAAMRRLVEDGMRAGSFGVSTGLAYAPGCYAAEHEVTALARAAAEHGGLYATHLRDEGLYGSDALEEALRIGKNAGIPVHLSHMKIAARALWGTARDRLKRIDEARSSGMRVTLDVYAYTASSTSLEILLPPAIRGSETPYKEVLKDARRRDAVVAGMLDQLRGDGFPDYSFARIAYFHRDHSLESLTIPEAAKQLGMASDARHVPVRVQAETVLKLLSQGGAQMIYFSMSETDMLTILRYPFSSIGTDSSVRSDEMRTAHPRGMGNFPRILGQYARERKAIPLGDALRQMTSLPADTFGFVNQGRIRRGAAADLVIFDPAKIRDNTSYDHPLEAPSGISWVIVNGAVVADPDGLTKALPGKVIRHDGAEKANIGPLSSHARE